MKPLVTIVIPVYNQLIYTKQCLVSIFKNTNHKNYKIIIIDNASTDGTNDFLQTINQSLLFDVISNRENIGFTLAANQGMQKAEGEFVLLLNNDILVETNWITGMLDVFARFNDAGIVGAKTLVPGTNLIHNIGGMVLTKKSMFLPIGKNALRWDQRFSAPVECQYIEGSCMCIKREVIEKIGFFDEVYSPAYYEDTDYCFRARAAGFKSYCAPCSEIYHYAGKTSDNGKYHAHPANDNERIFRSRWQYFLPERP